MFASYLPQWGHEGEDGVAGDRGFRFCCCVTDDCRVIPPLNPTVAPPAVGVALVGRETASGAPPLKATVDPPGLHGTGLETLSGLIGRLPDELPVD
jgi:hypothetical protein